MIHCCLAVSRMRQSLFVRTDFGLLKRDLGKAGQPAAVEVVCLWLA